MLQEPRQQSKSYQQESPGIPQTVWQTPPAATSQWSSQQSSSWLQGSPGGMQHWPSKHPSVQQSLASLQKS
jgi:hypothetical protein